MRKYAIVSIVVNVILLLIYFVCFHSRRSFKDTDSISKTLKKNSEVLVEDQKRHNEATLESLQFKTRLSEIVSDEFCENEICIKNFSKIIHKYIHADITEDKMEDILESYNSSINQLNVSYLSNMTRSQKEAKLTDRELDKIIHSFYLKTNNNLRIDQNDLSNLSANERKLVLRAMESHLIQLQFQANNGFSSHVGYRGFSGLGNRSYAVVFTSKNNIKKGDAFDSKIRICNHIDRKHKNYCRIELDEKNIEFDYFGHSDFSLAATPIGLKKHELILSWVNPISKEIKIDTSYVEYIVIP